MTATTNDVRFSDVADQLLAAASGVEHDRRDEARARLTAIEGRLTTLAGSARRLHDDARADYAAAAEALAGAVQLDTNLYHHQIALDAEIDELEGAIQGRHEAIGDARRELEKRAAALSSERRTLASQQAKVDRLRDDSAGSILLSIFTLGLDRAVMAIEVEASGTRDRIADLRRKIRRIEDRRSTLNQDIDRYAEAISLLRSDSRALANRRRMLHDRRRGAEYLKTRFAALAAFLHQVDEFYRQVASMLEGLDTRVDEIVDIVDALDAPAGSIHDLDDTGEYVGTLRAALDEFDDLAESGPSGIVRHVTPATGLTTTSVGVTTGGWFEEDPRTALGTWREYGPDGREVADFVESARDAWSVYLFDERRDVHLALDMHRKRVRFRHGNEPFWDLYVIDHGCTVLTCATPCKELRS